MTIETQNDEKHYVGDDATTDFPFPYPVVSDDELFVYIDGVLSEDWSWMAPNVVFDPAPADGVLVDIYRDTTPLQLFDAASNPTDSALEAQLDRLTKAVISIRAQLQTAVRSPRYVQDTTSLTLPGVAERLSKFLAFDASGNLVAAAGTVAGGSTPFSSFALALVALTTNTDMLALLEAVDRTTGAMDILDVDGNAAIGGDATIAGSLLIDALDVTGDVGCDNLTAAGDVDGADIKRDGTSLPIQRFAESSGYTPAAHDTGSWTHGFAAAQETIFQAFYRCLADELGYVAGEVLAYPGWIVETNNYGLTWKIDATTLTYRTGASGMVIPHATSGVATALTPAKWQFFFRGWGR